MGRMGLRWRGRSVRFAPATQACALCYVFAIVSWGRRKAGLLVFGCGRLSGGSHFACVIACGELPGVRLAGSCRGVVSALPYSFTAGLQIVENRCTPLLR